MLLGFAQWEQQQQQFQVQFGERCLKLPSKIYRIGAVLRMAHGEISETRELTVKLFSDAGNCGIVEDYKTMNEGKKNEDKSWN